MTRITLGDRIIEVNDCARIQVSTRADRETREFIRKAAQKMGFIPATLMARETWVEIKSIDIEGNIIFDIHTK